jgi:hypothetical protein
MVTVAVGNTAAPDLVKLPHRTVGIALVEKQAHVPGLTVLAT